ncbi:MAG: L-lysine 6-transaminase [Planctomycetia bacterium]|nr:MAG: L-lysine 6-transaminase [Planctomycetia bacterium]
MTVMPKMEMSPTEAMDALRSRLLVDGFKILLDLEASHGVYLADLLTGREYLDMYAFFAAQPIGYNHPRMREPQVQQELLTAATTKPANPDVYTPQFARFVKTLSEIAGLPGFEHYFFIDGGALAVENALKTAFDWKVRKNMAAGRHETGFRVIHFSQAFHGRTGYTLSLTNTSDPKKTMYFPLFDWPRIDNPRIDFSLPEPQRTQDVIAREQAALRQIHDAIRRYGHDIACLIIEPIQGEGGDNHFRPEFLRALRDICDRHEMLLIFDEVQTGVGLTGSMWYCEQTGVLPDILCFGKKMQICGIMCTRRIDDVDNVFKVSSRINSTFGGNLADMVRATEYLRIIRDENLVERARTTGEHLQKGLHDLARRHPRVTAVRGKGLMCAFDLPDGKSRDALRKTCQERYLLLLSCGDRSIRFRPVLDIDPADVDRGLKILNDAIQALP